MGEGGGGLPVRAHTPDTQAQLGVFLQTPPLVIVLHGSYMVGEPVGDFVGVRVGAFVGADVGAFVGATVGAFVGACEVVGALVVGAGVGALVGPFVGALDVGAGVGALVVGAAVGLDVPHGPRQMETFAYPGLAPISIF